MLQAELRAAEADLKGIEAQRQFESENDNELSTLQRVVSALTVNRVEQIRVAKQVRAERERLRESATTALYSRLGSAREVQFVASLTDSGLVHTATPARCVPSAWPAGAVALWLECEALWKKVSTLSESTRDLVEGALALRGATTRGSDTAEGLASDWSGVTVYTTLGWSQVLSDAAKVEAAVVAVADELDCLGRSCEGLLRAAGGDSSGEESTPSRSSPLAVVRDAVAAAAQNVWIQRALLRAAVHGDEEPEGWAAAEDDAASRSASISKLGAGSEPSPAAMARTELQHVASEPDPLPQDWPGRDAAADAGAAGLHAVDDRRHPEGGGCDGVDDVDAELCAGGMEAEDAPGHMHRTGLPEGQADEEALGYLYYGQHGGAADHGAGRGITESPHTVESATSLQPFLQQAGFHVHGAGSAAGGGYYGGPAYGDAHTGDFKPRAL